MTPPPPPDPLLDLRVNICHSVRAEVVRNPSFGKQIYYQGGGVRAE